MLTKPTFDHKRDNISSLFGKLSQKEADEAVNKMGTFTNDYLDKVDGIDSNVDRVNTFKAIELAFDICDTEEELVCCIILLGKRMGMSVAYEQQQEVREKCIEEVVKTLM